VNILIIGGGGREHCLAWKVSASDLSGKIFAIPGNPGISQIGECISTHGIDAGSFDRIADFAEQNNIGFTIVGPEAPLVEGIVDFFNARNLKIFGPDKKAARLEGSKVFTKELSRKYKIPTAESTIFAREEHSQASKYIKSLPASQFPVVLKVDGLAAGKGVIICEDRQKALLALNDCFVGDMFGSSGNFIIIEQFIEGFEVSILNLCDGKNLVPMVPAQDYKKIFDNDQGKNTGGMGSYCPVPFVNERMYGKILDEIIFPTYEALCREGLKYRGILYGGIIISEGQPFLLEYNCRFGDPETQAILPRLEDDLLELLLACENGTLGDRKLNWDESKCVCVVVASKGYPESSSKGDIISGLDDFKSTDQRSAGSDRQDVSGVDTIIFHAGTKSSNGQIFTDGGRILGVVSKSDTFRSARKKAYSRISDIYFDGMQYRKDIALRVEEVQH